jgi:hypothetical protein
VGSHAVLAEEQKATFREAGLIGTWQTFVDVSRVMRDFPKKIPTQRKFVWNNRTRPPPDNAGTSMKFRAPKELLQIYLQTSPSH